MGCAVFRLFVIMAGQFMIGFGFIGAAAFLGFTLPQKLMWVKHTLVP